jgi:hypothetical protein
MNRVTTPSPEVTHADQVFKDLIVAALDQGGSYLDYTSSHGPRTKLHDGMPQAIFGPWAHIDADTVREWLRHRNGSGVSPFTLRIDADFPVAIDGPLGHGFTSRIGLPKDTAHSLSREPASERPAVAPLELDELIRVLREPQLALWPANLTMDGVMRQAAAAIEILRYEQPA